MKVFFHLAIALLAASVANADVRLSMRDGRIAIVAKDATVAEILAEWAKIGRTRIVNADRLPSDVVTLELQNVSEQQALDVLLRGTSGYLAVPRADADPNASLFDRIAIMAPSVPPPATNASAIKPGAHRAPPAVAEGTSAIVRQQSPIAPAEPADQQPNGAIDEEPRAVIIGGTVSSTEIAERQATFSSRHMLEVANPRDFKMPSRPVGAVTAPPAGGVPPVIGAAVPGVITPPAPQPARVPRQPPAH